jgi:hypothetical protein
MKKARTSNYDHYVRQMYSRYSAYMTEAIASERLVRVYDSIGKLANSVGVDKFNTQNPPLALTLSF